MPRSIAPSSPRSIPSTRPPCASSTRPAAPSSAPPRSATTARPPGSRRSARPAACRRQGSTPQNALPPDHQGRAARKGADQGPHHAVGLRRLGAAGGRLLVESGADLRYVGTACPRTPLVGGRSRVARSGRRAGPVPRLARAGPRGDGGVQARSRDRHHAGRAEGEGEGDPGPLLHQPDLGAPADGPGRRRLAGAGRQRRARQQGALRRDARLLRRRRHRATMRPASGRTCPRPAGVPRAQALEARPSRRRSARPRRWI
jgi:hypothetical protein